MAPTALHEHAPPSHCGYLFAKLTYELTRLAKLGSFWQIEPIELMRTLATRETEPCKLGAA